MNTSPSFHNQTILLVSDSVLVAQAMEQFVFNGLGMQVVARMHTFDNIQDAVRRFVPDVMIGYFSQLDTQQIECVRLAAIASPHLHILVIASTLSISLVQEVFSAGARGYLLDMPSREELLDALGRMMEHRIALDARLRATPEGKRLVIGW